MALVRSALGRAAASVPGNIAPQKEIRVAMAALIRITSGDNYVLIRNLHRPESFAPLGGVYKYFDEARHPLDTCEFRAQVVDADMVKRYSRVPALQAS